MLVLQIRDAAGDALTGLVSPAEVGKVCLRTLEAVETCGENEVRSLLCQAASDQPLISLFIASRSSRASPASAASLIRPICR